jgi:CDP-diacylglycerol pyrophosphatase
MLSNSVIKPKIGQDADHLAVAISCLVGRIEDNLDSGKADVQLSFLPLPKSRVRDCASFDWLLRVKKLWLWFEVRGRWESML